MELASFFKGKQVKLGGIKKKIKKSLDEYTLEDWKDRLRINVTTLPIQGKPDSGLWKCSIKMGQSPLVLNTDVDGTNETYLIINKDDFSETEAKECMGEMLQAIKEGSHFDSQILALGEKLKETAKAAVTGRKNSKLANKQIEDMESRIEITEEQQEIPLDESKGKPKGSPTEKPATKPKTPRKPRATKTTK